MTRRVAIARRLARPGPKLPRSARVGRRLVVIDSSICVAVMTGLPKYSAWNISFF